MGKLIYLMNVSLDGYIETPDHSVSIRPLKSSTLPTMSQTKNRR